MKERSQEPKEVFAVTNLMTKFQRYEEIKSKLTKNPECKSCHGTGVVGIQLVPGRSGHNGLRQLNEQLMLCHCASFIAGYQASMDAVERLGLAISMMAGQLDKANAQLRQQLTVATRMTLFGGIAYVSIISGRKLRRSIEQVVAYLRYAFTPAKPANQSESPDQPAATKPGVENQRSVDPGHQEEEAHGSDKR